MKYLIFIIFFFSCADKNFIVFSIDGEKLNDDIYDTGNISINKFDLFFSKNDINRDYIEVNIIATNYFHYGQFFFDKNFMKMLESRTINSGADALIYEKNRKDFPDYDESFLYFTAIKYKN